MSTCLHHVSGRIRVRVLCLKRCAAAASVLKSKLMELPGVTDVDCRIITGSVVVSYQPAMADVDVILQVLGCSELLPAFHSPQPASRQGERFAGRVAQAALWMALEAAAERAIPMLFAAVL